MSHLLVHENVDFWIKYYFSQNSEVMSVNLLELLKNQVSGQLAKNAFGFLGESEYAVTSALDIMLPALLGSVIQKTSSSVGAQSILDMIEKSDLDSLGDIAGFFGGGASKINVLLHSGGEIIETLMGSKSKVIADLISNLNSMKSGSTSTLLKLAAPFLMAVIGTQIKGKSLSFFSELMMDQRSAVKDALPVGLVNRLNFEDFGVSKDVNTGITTSVSSDKNNSWMKWILPVLMAVAVLYWLGAKGCGKKVAETSETITSEVDSAAMNAVNTAGSAVDSMNSAIEKLFQYKLSSGFELAGAAKDGIESQIITFIEDESKVVDKTTWFDFDRLLFDTNKATLQPESQEQLKNIAQILHAFPTVKLKIGGYTDNTGDPKANQRLSTDRSFNVMNELIELGVDKSRLSTEGYGDKFPVADNSTEEGKQKNRRISVRVIEK